MKIEETPDGISKYDVRLSVTTEGHVLRIVRSELGLIILPSDEWSENHDLPEGCELFVGMGDYESYSLEVDGVQWES